MPYWSGHPLLTHRFHPLTTRLHPHLLLRQLPPLKPWFQLLEHRLLLSQLPPPGTVVPATGTLTPTGPLAPRTVPEECTNEGFVFQNGQLLLNSQNSPVNSQLYMIRNNSDYEQLSITHPSNTPIAGAGQSQSRLDQGQWSALSINQPNFVINCFGRKPGVAAYVDCKSVLQVCSYPKVNMSGGDHWIAENKPLLDTISSLQNKNVTMPR